MLKWVVCRRKSIRLPQIKVQSMYLQAISAFGYLGNGLTVFTGPHLVSLRLPLLKKFWVADTSIGNRIRPTWTANQSSKYYLEALSAFGYLERVLRSCNETVLRSLQVPAWLACTCRYSKSFGWLTGPLGIGSDPPGHRSKFKVFTSRL